jgi:hypothetical protein
MAANALTPLLGPNTWSQTSFFAALRIVFPSYMPRPCAVNRCSTFQVPLLHPERVFSALTDTLSLFLPVSLSIKFLVKIQNPVISQFPHSPLLPKSWDKNPSSAFLPHSLPLHYFSPLLNLSNSYSPFAHFFIYPIFHRFPKISFLLDLHKFINRSQR